MASVPVVVWVFAVTSLVLLAVGAGMLLWTWADVSRSARAEATVVLVEAEDASDKQVARAMKARFLHAEFTDRRGLRQSFFLGATMDIPLMGLSAEAQKLPSPGAKIPILFDPSNPKRARRDTFAELWRTPMVVLLAGAGLAVCSAVVAIAVIRDLQ